MVMVLYRGRKGCFGHVLPSIRLVKVIREGDGIVLLSLDEGDTP